MAAASRSSRSTAGRAWPMSRRALRDGYSSAGTRGNGLGARHPAIAFCRYRFLAGGRHRRPGARRKRRRRTRSAANRIPAGARCRSPCRARRCVATPGASPATGAFARCSLPTVWAMDTKPRRPPSRRCGCFIASAATACRHCSITSMAACARPAARRFRSRGSILRPRRMIFAGIGNVAGTLAADGESEADGLDAGNGRLQRPKNPVFRIPVRRAGLSSSIPMGSPPSWTLGRISEFGRPLHPTLIAAILYRDFSRRRDDATVLVGKWVGRRQSMSRVRT